MICFPPRHMWPCFHSFSQVEWWQHCLADDTASISDYQFCFINWALRKPNMTCPVGVLIFVLMLPILYAFLPLVVNLESVSVCLQQWPGKCVCVFTAVTWKVCLCLYSHVYLFTWKVLWLLVGFHLDSDREKRPHEPFILCWWASQNNNCCDASSVEQIPVSTLMRRRSQHLSGAESAFTRQVVNSGANARKKISPSNSVIRAWR